MQKLVERAEKLGFRLPLRTLSDLERGARQDPQLSTLLAISGGLGIELSWLVQVLDNFNEYPEEPARKTPKNSIEALREKIRRKDTLIRKWKREADAFDPRNNVGRAVKRYCQGLARWQEEERDKLQARIAAIQS
jgi:transcriptional regulator with XRE-family HTH domain